jgi:hypothetical protein
MYAGVVQKKFTAFLKLRNMLFYNGLHYVIDGIWRFCGGSMTHPTKKTVLEVNQGRTAIRPHV